MLYQLRMPYLARGTVFAEVPSRISQSIEVVCFLWATLRLHCVFLFVDNTEINVFHKIYSLRRCPFMFAANYVHFSQNKRKNE